MLALVVALALSQTSVEPSIVESPRSASLFSSPRVTPGKPQPTIALATF